MIFRITGIPTCNDRAAAAKAEYCACRKKIGLKTRLDTVSSPIRLNCSEQTFYGKRFVSQKTYVSTVG